jgi:2-methylisocitrate lyase-like PEP mutase family enzyme
MTDQRDRIARFRQLHAGPELFLIPNPWDAGAAKVLAHLGFQALATTSSGFAATLGRLDHGTTRDEAIAGARAIVEATDLPVSADLEHGYGAEPASVADTVVAARGAGLAGCSIEDATGHRDEPVFPYEQALERVRAAVEASGTGEDRIVITARAENHLYGIDDLDDTIRRLQGFQEAGADVLFAPGVVDLDAIRTVVRSVDRPVNVLGRPGVPPIEALAEAGVRRVSVGGGLAWAAMGGLVDAATELLERGTYDLWYLAGRGLTAAGAAHTPPP